MSHRQGVSPGVKRMSNMEMSNFLAMPYIIAVCHKLLDMPIEYGNVEYPGMASHRSIERFNRTEPHQGYGNGDGLREIGQWGRESECIALGAQTS
jgi:hypothetical protein